MSSGFGEIAMQAHHLVTAGDLAGARELLGQALVNADPRPSTATPDLAEAAGLQARILVTIGDPHSARGWAAFAYAAATRLFGPSDPRTVAAAATLAAVLHRVGSHVRAANLYRDVIIELTASDGPESLRVLAAHADLATVEYARGDCWTARTRLADAWELHREVYGDGSLGGIRMLARLGAMERDCGRFTEAHEHLLLARELCRQHLPADHALANQVAALTQAAANPDHVCGGAHSPDLAAPSADPPAGTSGTAGTGSTAAASSTTGTADPAGTAGADRWQGGAQRTAPYRGPENRAAAAYGVGSPPPVPPSRLPPGSPAPPYGPADRFVAGQPDQIAVPPPRTAPPDEATSLAREGQWWPPDAPEPESESESDPNPADRRGCWSVANGDPPEPDPHTESTWAKRERLRRAGTEGGAEEAEGVHRVRHLPERRSSRLPVAVERPPAGRSRPKLPILLAGLVVVLLGALAVIVGFALVDGGESRVPGGGPTSGAGPTSGSTSTLTPTPATPGTTPGEVTLTDNTESVTLSWIYPAGAEGPVVVSGGRTGQVPRAFQELPAGSTDYVVYGLPPNLDYCFTVAVVWSTDVIGRAEPVCTERASRSPSQ